MYLAKILLLTTLLLSNDKIENNKLSDEFWITDYDVAIAQAKNENKIVMLYFSGSDWCKPCIIWKKEVFDTDTFHSYANTKLVPVKLDFPRMKKNKLTKEQEQMNEELAGKYNKGGVFPFIVFLDASGNVIEKTSYRKESPNEFIAYVDGVIAQNSK